MPARVLDDVAAKIREGVTATVAEYDSAHEDEDTLTGHLGARLTNGERKVSVLDRQEVLTEWTWSLRYKKFRGRGPGATEKYLGADGIFELTVLSDTSKETKSILFQSKMPTSNRRDLINQCVKLSTWREAAFVLLFSSDEISAVTIDNILGSDGIPKDSHKIELSDYLINYFLACLVGDNDLSYSATKRELNWHTIDNTKVYTKFNVKHRFKITVQQSQSLGAGIPQEISPEDIHKHRMSARPEEILSLDAIQGAPDAQKARKALAKIYHPDRFENSPPQIKELIKVRMQEINHAADVARVRK